MRSATKGTLRRLVGLSLLGPCLAAGACTSAPPPPPANVLLVSIDSLRPDHLGAYGYKRPTSPALDRLATQGVLFRDVVSPSSWTLPAHISLLTGLSPDQHGVVTAFLRLDESARTLAEVFSDRGYRTAAFVSGPFLRSAHGYAQGFDRYEETIADRPEPQSGESAAELVEAVDAWITAEISKAPEVPFFVFLHIWDVHYDYLPPPPYDRLFDPHYRGSISGRDFHKDASIHAGMSARDLAHIVALYDGEIRYVDDQLARLFSRLKDLGLEDDTLIAVTSDHGDEFFEHGNKGHKKTLYEESVKIPLIMRYPRKIPAGTVISSPTRLIDIPPTLLALAGESIPGDFALPRSGAREALDLAPWIRGQRSTESFPSLDSFGHLTLIVEEFAYLRRDRTKVVLSRKTDLAPSRPDSDDKDAGSGDVKFFDLDLDPGEGSANRPGSAGDRDGLTDRLESRMMARDPSSTFASPIRQTEVPRERLRALGYLE
jgi:arylsulfatase A-like enzyme